MSAGSAKRIILTRDERVGAPGHGSLWHIIRSGWSSGCLLFNSFQFSLLVQKSVVGSLMLRNQMMTTTVSSKLSQLPQSFLYLFKFSLLFIADAYNTRTAPFLRDRLKVNLRTSVRKRKAFWSLGLFSFLAWPYCGQYRVAWLSLSYFYPISKN